MYAIEFTVADVEMNDRKRLLQSRDDKKILLYLRDVMSEVAKDKALFGLTFDIRVHFTNKIVQIY